MKTRKTGIILLVLLLTVLFAALSVAEETAPKAVISAGTGIIRETEAGPELVLFTGKTAKLACSLENVANPKKAKFAWESSNPEVALIKNGTLTGKSAGTADVTCSATLEDGSVISASIHVSVEVSVVSVTLSAKTVTLFTGESSEPVTVAFKPENATCRDVTWTSADESIARVDENGVITGVKAGKTVIYAVSNEVHAAKAKPKQAQVSVVVNQAVTNIMLGGKIDLAKGKSQKLAATIFPEDATNKKVEWISSNPDIVAVSAAGVAVGKKVGTAIITCRTLDGSDLSATVQITVYQSVTAVKPNTAKVVVTEGKTKSLSVTVSPADATDKSVSWSSSNSSVATVSSSGVVTAKNAGSCTITATSKDGSNKKANFQVIVEPKVPLDATTFTRSGYFGYYYEFAITFKNLTKTRTIKYISFDLKYNYSGSTYTLSGCYTDSDTLGPGRSKRIGWWDQIGYKLSYCSNFRIYLKSVKYSDGTWDYFDDVLLGWFN